MRDLPNPSLIDKEFSPPPVEDHGQSWVSIGLVTVLFVVTSFVFAADDGRPLRGNLLSSASPMEPVSAVSTKGFDQAQGRGR